MSSPNTPDSNIGDPTPAPGEAKVCPECKRKLLTQTSAFCNWCGAKIDDPEFQAQAAAHRRALDEQERAGLEAIVQEEARYGVLGRLKRRAKTNPARPGGGNPLAGL